ncbi:MAG: lysostaphin resistance A-like protein, partial [Bacteroidia bacterium]
KLTDPKWTGGSVEMTFITVMLMFVCSMILLWVAVKFIHKRPFQSIITASSRIRWGRMWTSFALWMVLSIVVLLVAVAMYPGHFTFQFQMQPFLISLLLGLLFFPIQTWLEEFLFRGYLMQGIGLMTKTAVLPILITGFLFGLSHLMNPEAHEYGMLAVLPQYVLPGIFLGLVACLDEGLEVAMGYHFANNLFGTVAVTSSSSAIQLNAMYQSKGILTGFDNLALLVQSLVFLAICWWLYKWNYKKIIH